MIFLLKKLIKSIVFPFSLYGSFRYFHIENLSGVQCHVVGFSWIIVFLPKQKTIPIVFTVFKIVGIEKLVVYLRFLNGCDK